ncbi:MAG: nicotinate-nucleotide adenylyltransferase [Kiritimatiellaeota bacterium]|nr:nicotinate-nucleotide adenylyltransferase [Kiritimatiellota bacterium]
MRRIGIFGGSFNPIHNGHLLAMQSAVETVGLDKLLVTPCYVSPFKRGAQDMASGTDRMAMVQGAVAGDARFEPCWVELERGDVSYAVDTVRQLQARYPDARLSLVIGMDTLRDLHLWHKADELVTLCDVITVQRPGFDETPAPRDLGFPLDVAHRLLARIIRGRLCEISSSEIRQRVAAGQPIRYLVPPAVEAYIREHGLYQTER